MPTNLYGPGDNFDLETSHVLPALIRRFHEAEQTGAPTRSSSGAPGRRAGSSCTSTTWLAPACVLLEHYDDPAPINVGVGEDVSIRELAELVAEIVGFDGRRSSRTPRKPDGTPRKLLDVSRINALGWRPEIGLREGIAQTYDWYRSTVAS